MMHLSRRTLLAGSSAAAAALATIRPRIASAQAPVGLTVADDGYTYMASNPQLTTWVQLIDAGGLQSYARAPTPYTVFPASDAAFAEFPGMVRDLLGYQYSTGSHNAQDAFPDNSAIVKLVRSHVTAGKHYPSEVMGRTITVRTVAGTPLTIDGTNPEAVRLTWNSAANGQQLSASLVQQPVTCVNAVVYVIDHIEKM
jgi:uncharacterized surface protein with fasciclin (FAS1) repeats